MTVVIYRCIPLIFFLPSSLLFKTNHFDHLTSSNILYSGQRGPPSFFIICTIFPICGKKKEVSVYIRLSTLPVNEVGPPIHVFFWVLPGLKMRACLARSVPLLRLFSQVVVESFWNNSASLKIVFQNMRVIK